MDSRLFTLLVSIVFFFVQSAFGSPALQDASVSSVFSLSSHWRDDRDQDVMLTAWQGQYLVLTMSYTRCKKICPSMTLAKLKEIDNFLRQKNVNAHFVTVTFDPENDTPKVLAEYRKIQHLTDERWHFLTGSSADTRQLADAMGLGDFYTMDDHIRHDFKIFVFSSTGEVRTLGWKHRDVASALSGLVH